MITVAIVGSREYPRLELVRQRVWKRVEAAWGDIRFVSGGARGVDTEAADAARLMRAPCGVILPDYEHFGRTFAPLARNQQIVAEADEMDAFWDFHSSGTPHAVELALAKGITVTLTDNYGRMVSPYKCIDWLARNRPNRLRPSVAV